MDVNILKIISQYSTHSELSNEYPLDHITQTFIFTQLRSIISINILIIDLKIISCSSIQSDLSNESSFVQMEAMGETGEL